MLKLGRKYREPLRAGAHWFCARRFLFPAGHAGRELSPAFETGLFHARIRVMSIVNTKAAPARAKAKPNNLNVRILFPLQLTAPKILERYKACAHFSQRANKLTPLHY